MCMEIVKTAFKLIFRWENFNMKSDEIACVSEAYEGLKANKYNYERRYKESVKKVHPDVGGETGQMQFITECYKYIKEYLKEL